MMNCFIHEVMCLIPLGLHSPSTTATVLSPNGVVINNASNPSAISVSETNTVHNGFIPGHSSHALDTKLTLSAPNNNSEFSEESTPSPGRGESAAYSQSFTVRAMLKESSAKPLASTSQPFTVDALSKESTKKPFVADSQFDEKIMTHAQGLCTDSRGLPFSCA